MIQAVTRLGQMKQAAMEALERQKAESDRAHALACDLINEFGKGVEDLAIHVGVIEPPVMPMLPPRVPTGPQPTFAPVNMSNLNVPPTEPLS
jgi:hypothetical protein